jgi:hypothetical protein
MQKSVLEHPTQKRCEGCKEMTDGPVPLDFDWVAARSECSLYRVFRELREGVTQDVEKRNTCKQPDNPNKWTVGAASDKAFTVFREETKFHPKFASVDFLLSDEGVTIVDWKKTKFTATLSLNNEGRCIFKIGKTELEQWQVRRMALENLFFGAI